MSKIPNVYFRASVSSYVNGNTIGCRKYLKLLKRLSDKDIDWVFEELNESIMYNPEGLDSFGDFEDGKIYKLEIKYTHDYEYGCDIDEIRLVKVDPENKPAG